MSNTNSQRLLLVAGSTETARQMITDEFLSEHADWRHLALEDIMNEEVEEEDDLGMQEAFMMMVACQCAKDELEKGNHVIITCPTSEMIGGVFQEFESLPTTVYLGTEDEADGFDHIIDASEKSMSDVSKFLNQIIQGQPA